MVKKIQVILSIIIMLAIAQHNFGQDNVKLAQTGLKFLSVGTDARASALGDAITSIEGNSSSIFYNPSGMARQTNLVDITFGNTAWIADINYFHASISVAPEQGLYGVFGLSVVGVDYGEFKGTIKNDNDPKGYTDIGLYSPNALAIGLSYAKALSDKFSVGGNVKYVYQDLGSHRVAVTSNGGYEAQHFDLNVISFDFGLLYHTGFKSLNFGMSIRNFSQEVEYIEKSFQLPLTFKLGLSMNLLDIIDMDKNEHSFLFSVDADHPRDFKEQLHIGGEYTFMNLLSLRAGYVTPTDEQGINAGVGIRKEFVGFNFGFDYSYLDFGLFDNVSRFSINISY